MFTLGSRHISISAKPLPGLTGPKEPESMKRPHTSLSGLRTLVPSTLKSQLLDDRIPRPHSAELGRHIPCGAANPQVFARTGRLRPPRGAATMQLLLPVNAAQCSGHESVSPDRPRSGFACPTRGGSASRPSRRADTRPNQCSGGTVHAVPLR